MTPGRPHSIAPLLLLAACLALGCERGNDIRTYAAPKEPPPIKPVEWAVPSSWRELRAGEMQYASFAVDPEQSDATLTVIPLPRESNELTPNVNRWERQLGLPPSPPDAVERMVTHVDVGDAHLDTVDLSGTDAVNGTGEPRRLLAAIVPRGTLTWFFTLKGPPHVVERQKANFDAFVRSLKFKPDPGAPADEGHARTQLAIAQTGSAKDAKDAKDTEDGHHPNDGHDHVHHEGDGHDHGPVAEKVNWGTLPAGWVEDPTPRQMRTHTLNVEADGKKGEVIVTRLPQTGVGQLLDNLNRWRGHVGLEPTTDPKAHAPREMSVVGIPGFAFDFEGPVKGGQPAKKQIVALTSQGNMFWFVRFIGPKELVDAQQKTFEKLLADVRFAGVAAPATQQQSSGKSSSTQPSGSAR